jgi:phosphate-selective porin
MKFALPLVAFLWSPLAWAQADIPADASTLPASPPSLQPASPVEQAHVPSAPRSSLAHDAPALVSLSTPPPLVPPLGPVPSNPPAFAARDGYPLAGRVGEYFYLRDANDDFRIYFDGRAQVDAYAPFGAGVSESAPGSGLSPTFFIRRARPELAGEFLRHWQWMISADWGRTAVGNSNGQTATPTCSVVAKTGVQTCVLRESSVESASYTAQLQDVYMNFRAGDVFNVEAGQILIPFTLENRTSTNFIPFLENSLPVRTLGAPNLRDIGIMAWGETPASLFHYEIGIFNGDGPNVLNQDSNFDGIGRVFAHPFAKTNTLLKTLQIGASGHYGVRSAKTVGYDYPSLTTQEGYAFWKPTYTDSNGNLIHIIPSNEQITAAGEIYWPVSAVDITSELVYADHDTREARDGYQLVYPDTERYGTLKGYSYYVEVGVWLAGDRQYVRRPGYQDPPHINFAKPLPATTSSIELLAKFEQLHLTYASASRAGIADAKSPDGDIDVDVVSFGASYWITRRVRLSLNYDWNIFPGSEPVTPAAVGDPKQSSSQRAVGPAQVLATGVDDTARENAHTLSEVTARAQVAF